MSSVIATATSVCRNTIWLQAAAAILIANSHLEAFYPKSWMAADGFLGNSMFFMLSGYGVALSLLGREQSFLQYYLRRILRIYPALLLIEIVFHYGLLGGWKTAGLSEYFQSLVYPTHYGYVRQIMVFYGLFYLLKRWLSGAVLFRLWFVMFLPMLGFYGFDLAEHAPERLHLGALNEWLWNAFFFQMMLLGGYLATTTKNPTFATSGRFIPLGLALGLAAYVGLKFLMVLGIKIPLLGMSFASLYIGLFLLVPTILYLAFVWFTASGWLTRLKTSPRLAWGVSLIGGLTLEIYLVHGYVFENEQIQKIIFPLNVAVFFVVTIGLAWAIQRVIQLVRPAASINRK